MSEPPPGAVLMTNSTGCVGWTAAAGEPDPEPVGVADDGALAVAQAVSVTSAAARSAVIRIAGLDMNAPPWSRYAPRCLRGHTGGLTASNPVTMAKAGRHGACVEPVQSSFGRRADQGVWAWCRS